MFVLLVVCLYGVVYGRLMDAKTWPLFGLYILRFIHYQKVFIPALKEVFFRAMMFLDFVVDVNIVR